jgi:type IV secretion system protein VirD4
MAGYGIRAYLIAQSLNQISKAYGENNAILDNCHVRVAFSSNDERTAKRISDALGTATEQRAQRNYAGHRLAPWLSHVMVSRQETARPLLTPGEVMQLPPSEELVLVSGLAPIRAKKLRYFEDQNFTSRLAPAPALSDQGFTDTPVARRNDWAGQVRGIHVGLLDDVSAEAGSLEDAGGLQHQRHPSEIEAADVKSDFTVTEADVSVEDDGELAADQVSMGQLRTASAVARADLVQVEAHHTGPKGQARDLIPGF